MGFDPDFQLQWRRIKTGIFLRRGAWFFCDPFMNSAASISASPFPAVVDFDQRQCGDLGFAESREWLVTNGIGGYASGTVAGLQTRSYHGLLIAALQPPGGRTLLAAKLDETAQYGGAPFDLATNRWLGGAVSLQASIIFRDSIWREPRLSGRLPWATHFWKSESSCRPERIPRMWFTG